MIYLQNISKLLVMLIQNKCIMVYFSDCMTDMEKSSFFLHNLRLWELLNGELLHKLLHQTLVKRLWILRKKKSHIYLMIATWHAVTVFYTPVHFITFFSSSLCFSTASSRLKPTHSTSSSGISNCCLWEMRGRQVNKTHRMIINTIWLQIYKHNQLFSPCRGCRFSPCETDHEGTDLCLSVPDVKASHVLDPCQTWSSNLASVSDLKEIQDIDHILL